MNRKMKNEQRQWLMHDNDGDANELQANGRTSDLVTTLPRIRFSTCGCIWTVSKMFCNGELGESTEWFFLATFESFHLYIMMRGNIEGSRWFGLCFK